MSNIKEDSLMEVAYAYAHAVGCLQATIKIVLESSRCTDQETIDRLKRGLAESEEILSKV